VYRFIRYGNAGNATGLSVDALVLSKTATNVQLAIAGGVGTFNYGAASYYAMLSDLPDYQDFTTLFDQYRIDKVEFILQPYCNMAASGAAYSTGSGQTGVIVHGAVDYDDATLPTASDVGIQALREYQNYQMRNLFTADGKPIVFSWKPRAAMAAYSGAFTSYASTDFPWVDCASNAVQGYGLKLIFEGVSSGTTVNIYAKVEARYHLSFRNVR